MDKQLKERLFGSIVLAAIAVIFIPPLFGTPIPRELSTNKPLPQAIHWDLDEKALQPPEALASVAEDTILSEARQAGFEIADKSASLPELPQTLKQNLTSRSQAASWAVQLGTFSDRENALLLQNKLKEQGFSAYTKTVNQQGHSLTRVLVGPEIDKASAAQLKDMLSRSMALNGLVIPYDPVAG